MEMRGIGGIFFENLGENVGSLQKIFDFCFDLGYYFSLFHFFFFFLNLYSDFFFFFF